MNSLLLSVRSVFLGILLAGWAAAPALATDWPPITPEDMSMTSVPQQPGAAAVILIRQETDDDLLHYQSVFVRIKILTEAGRRFADVEIPYNRHHSGIAEVSGRTVHADGSIVPLQEKPMDKVVLKQHGLRIYVKSFNLPDAQVGSILDYGLRQLPEQSRNHRQRDSLLAAAYRARGKRQPATRPRPAEV